MPDYREKKARFHSFFHRADSSLNETRIILPSGMLVRKISLTVPALSGQSFLFFTDTHLHAGRTLNLFAPPGSPREWSGTKWIESALCNAMEVYHPDYLLFGGDLVTYSSMYPDALKMLSHLHGARGQLAVYGNWDKHRRHWFPYREIERMYADVGWRILSNEMFESNGLEIYGLDDYKIGLPRFYHSGSTPSFALLLSHNPDSAAEMPPDELGHFDLALCGHTHGGQIRLPGFGALKASSRYWKRFEYGTFENRLVKTRMIVSAGIGATCLPCRINCPPEIVLIRFV